MYLHVSFEDGAEKEIPVSTAHVLEIKDNTLGTVDSFAFDGVTWVSLNGVERPDDEDVTAQAADDGDDLPSPLAGD